MIWIYRLLFIPAFFLMLPFYLPRMLRRGGYGRDFGHRLGAFPKLPPKRPGVRRIWLQAVSVGEVGAVETLVRELVGDGKTEIVLTTTTSTGYAVAREKFAAAALFVGIFPVDFWLFSRRAWQRVQPDLVVLMESELWPEHLRQAREHGVPVALVNARMSDTSFRRYARFHRLARSVFCGVSAIGAGSGEDFRRLVSIGVPESKITLTGNLKFESGAVAAPPTDAAEQARWRALLGFGTAPEAPILLGSSTWPGEEALLLDVLRRAREQGIPLRLLLVPRHAERRAEISTLLERSPWHWFLRSQHRDAAPCDADVCVADTTGELARLTALATVAFVGKSLPPNEGGQSPLECAALGVPLVYGPRMTNFREIARGLELAQAVVRTANAAETAEALLALLASTEKRTALSENIRRWHLTQQGATRATIRLLNSLYPCETPK